MVTALREVCGLRSELPQIDLNNSNRYCILSKEKDCMTAYCFATPVYNATTRRLVRREFGKDGELYRFSGSNANCIVHHGKLILTNANGSISIDLPTEKTVLNDGNLCVGAWTVSPTFNGISVHCNHPSVKFRMCANRPFLNIRHCSKSFAIMQEEFCPFLTVTPLFSSEENGSRFPGIVEYQQSDDRSYQVCIRATKGDSVDFELNLYEPKLFQDTTVESLHPKENNAYGGISFLGKTEWTGEQWLYSRPDLTKIPELYSVTVKKVLLHLPLWNDSKKTISVYAPTARFCSFGSNWENKIGQTDQLSITSPNGKYLTVDLTKIITDVSEQCLIHSNGLVLKPKIRDDSFVAVSTGDNYALPQILEVQYEQ